MGLANIAKLFRTTAEAERIHAEGHLKAMDKDWFNNWKTLRLLLVEKHMSLRICIHQCMNKQ